MKPALSIRNLSVVHGRRAAEGLARADSGEAPHDIRVDTGAAIALIDIDLDLFPGEIVVLLGSSGSGKTALVDALEGRGGAARGGVAIDTKQGPLDPAKAGRNAVAKSLAAIRTPPALAPRKTLLALLVKAFATAGTPRSERAPAAERALASAGLAALAEIRCADLPPAARPRLELLLALIRPAPVLVLDGAFSAPDALREPGLLVMLRQARDVGRRAILLASRDPAEALRVGDRIALLDNGRLAQVGTPSELLLEPATSHVAALLADVNPAPFLRARDIMTPIENGDVAGRISGMVQPDAPLERVLAALAKAPGEVVVADRGRLLGKIGPGDALRPFTSER